MHGKDGRYSDMRQESLAGGRSVDFCLSGCILPRIDTGFLCDSLICFFKETG